MRLSWEDYLEAEKGKGVSPSTLRDYKTRFPYFQKRLGKPLEKATVRDLQYLFAKLEKEGLGSSTVRTYGAILKGYYSWRTETGGKDEQGFPKFPSPMSGVSLPEPKRTEMPSLTKKQIDTILKHLKHKDQTTFDITDLTVRHFFRVGELIPARYAPDGSNPKRNEIEIRTRVDEDTGRRYMVGLFKVKGTGGKAPEQKTRELELKREDVKRVRRLLEQRITLTTYRRRLQKAAEELGFDVKLTHRLLRHSLLTNAAKELRQKHPKEPWRAAGELARRANLDIKQAMKYVRPSTEVREVKEKRAPILPKRLEAFPPFDIENFDSLAQHIIHIDDIARRRGLSIDFQNRFEDMVFGMFKMMQLDVEQRGYVMAGRNQPDGVIKARPFLVVYDCKTSRDPYSPSLTERRKIRDYIESLHEEFKHGYNVIVFLLVSHSFDSKAWTPLDQLRRILEAKLPPAIRIGLLRTSGLKRLLEKAIQKRLNLSVFNDMEGIMDDRWIEQNYP